MKIPVPYQPNPRLWLSAGAEKTRPTGDANLGQSLLLVKAMAALAMVLLLSAVSYGQKKNSCTECHSQFEGTMNPVPLMSHDIHQSRGLSCHDCHGGDASQDDPGKAMDTKKGFVGKPAPTGVPAFCGKCHSNPEFMKRFTPAIRVDQEQEYFTSVHGKKLKTGDLKVATCISCHGAHGIRGIRDPLATVFPLKVAETCSQCHANAEYMKSYGIPTDQFAKYSKSVHAKALIERQDLSAPSCNACHGNHGAVPPGISSVAAVCGQCHARQSTLFQSSPHKTAFDGLKVGECIICHNNHDILAPHDSMLGVGDQSVCVNCHTKGDSGFEGAQKMRAMLDEFNLRFGKADEILTRAERAGMEVSRSKFELAEAKSSLVNTRVLIHTCSVSEVEKTITPGLEASKKAYVAGEMALSEVLFRRKWLAISLFFIVFLAGVVYLKLRAIESRQTTSDAPPPPLPPA